MPSTTCFRPFPNICLRRKTVCRCELRRYPLHGMSNTPLRGTSRTALSRNRLRRSFACMQRMRTHMREVLLRWPKSDSCSTPNAQAQGVKPACQRSVPLERNVRHHFWRMVRHFPVSAFFATRCCLNASSIGTELHCAMKAFSSFMRALACVTDPLSSTQ